MGLFRTAARASVATRVVGNTKRRQQQRWEAEDAAKAQASGANSAPVAPAAPVAPVAPASSNMDAQIAQLQQLGKLRDAGVLTEEEFNAQKRKVLGES